MATLINVNSNALGTVSPVDGTSDDVILTITVVAGGETFDLSDTGTIQFQTWTSGNAIIVDGAGFLTSLDITGSNNDETITGGDAGDTITGGLGVDEIYGGDGDDILVVDGDAGDAVAGETYDGGGNTDTLQVTGDADFTGSTITSIEK
ncbi:MAG: hypothetical protein KDJ86_15855, partial [Bauldia sp.]|uniref:calcium-binding protein n=1 Tax=Bauldia sp. TaxID=2575872 RepID=UPI001D81548E|nr:hypothetical protein [Bauldia sp.]